MPRVAKLSKMDDANNDEYIITELTSDEDREEERPDNIIQKDGFQRTAVLMQLGKR